MKRFTAMWVPNNPSANRLASRKMLRPRLVTEFTSSSIWPGPDTGARLRMLSMVGITSLLTMATVRSAQAVLRFPGCTTPSRSKPRIRSAFPVFTFAGASIGRSLSNRCDTTAPPFCAVPVWSSVATERPSIHAAVASRALMVTTPLALLGLLLIVEQGNEVGWSFAQVHDSHDSGRMAMVNALADTQDLATWLRTRRDRNRVEVNEKDIAFNFGDWYRMDVDHTYGASMLTATSELGGWWGGRIGRMYGLNYVASRTPTRGGLQEMITGKTGIKLWYNPDAFPRAWTVHQIVVAPNESSGADMMNNWPFDLRATALTVRSKPALDTCGGADKVLWIGEKPSQVWVNVEMECKGLLIVSDNLDAVPRS